MIRNLLAYPACTVLTVLLVVLCGGGCALSHKLSHRNNQPAPTVAICDTLHQQDTLWEHEVTQQYDTTIGIAARSIEMQFPALPLHDTLLRNGPLQLEIHHGRISCAADSLTLVVKNMTRVLDSFRSVSRAGDKRITTVTLSPTEHQQWYAELLREGKNALALVGAITLVIILTSLIIKKSIL